MLRNTLKKSTLLYIALILFAGSLSAQETGLVTSYSELQKDDVIILMQNASNLLLGSKNMAANNNAACLAPYSMYNQDVQYGIGYMTPSNLECQFYVKSTQSESIKYYLHATSANTWTTQIGEYTSGGLTTWYLHSNADGTTKIRNSQTTARYLGSDATTASSSLYRDKTNYVDWKIYKVSEIQSAKATELEKTSNDAPIDITEFSVLNPSFELGDPELGWRNNGFQRQNNNAFSGTKDGAYYCEKWVATGSNLPSADMYQKLTGLPNGKYQITLQGGIKVQSSTGGADVAGEGMQAFANYASVPMKSIISDVSVTAAVTNGELTFGIKLDDVTGNYAYFDNVKLQYFGNSLEAYISTLDPMIERSNDILNNGAYPVMLGDTLQAAVQMAETAKTSSDVEEVVAAINKLSKALVLIEQTTSDYQELKNYMDEIDVAIHTYNRTDLSAYYDTLQTAFDNQLWDATRINAEIARKENLFFTVELDPSEIKDFEIKQRINVELVESSFPVGFAQAIAGENHYISYYDKDKNFCVGYRKLDESSFKKTILNSKIGWDSHNYIEMIVDNEGYIHISGNMHNVQLNYWRSKNPYDASAFEALHRMTGSEEDNTTYPKFLMTNSGDLLFHYRYGWSGNGYEVYDIWHPETKTWSRFLDKPLIDGQGLRNAYMQGPYYEKDGYYHLHWVWRETPDAASNHDFSYARSKDLKNWESAAGESVASPILFNETKLRVDVSTKMYGTGILNNVPKHTLDSQNRILLSNMKYDELGNSQLYVYRLKADNTWEEKRITNWVYRFQFGGGGSLLFEINVTGMRNLGNGEIGVSYTHSKYGVGEIILDETTLETIAIREYAKSYPVEFDNVTIAGAYSKPISVKIKQTGNFLLRWEAMGASNDQKPSGTLPPHFMLEVIELESDSVPNNVSKNINEGTLNVQQLQSNLKISGLNIGDSVTIIDVKGVVYKQFNATKSEYTLPASHPGFYILSSGGKTCKFLIK